MGAGETLPAAIADVLRNEGVACGWLRANGVVEDVELGVTSADPAARGPRRRIAGRVQLLMLEGAIGLTDGRPATSLRAVVGRETDLGLEAIAGELTRARTVALEAFVTALDDVAIERTLDPAGVWLLGGVPAASVRGEWSGAVEASAEAEREGRDSPGRGAGPSRVDASARGGTIQGQLPGSTSVPIPPRRPPGIDLDTPVPEPGDVVDHFAFGRCDVLKSDGDRLHLRVHKDGRIREIALEMLRVTRLPDGPDAVQYKLERRL